MIAQKAHDELRVDAQAIGGLDLGSTQAFDDRGELHPSGGVGLGVEEDLGIDQVLVGDRLEVGHAELVEVELGHEHGVALVAGIEERRQIIELV